MLRVNKDNLCPICLKPDWCLVSEDGRAAICARIKEGSTCSAGEAGYLFILDEKYVPKPYVPKEYPPIDWLKLIIDYYHDGGIFLPKLAAEWNVNISTLRNLFIGWDGEAYNIAMRNGNFEVIGIHRRFPDGTKCAVSGSKNGLFYSICKVIQPELIIVEGASDCATILDMGFYAIGRPNCSGGKEYIKEFIENNPVIKKVLIIGENDAAGMEGSKKLKKYIKNLIYTILCLPPQYYNDVREWRQKEPNIKETIQEWLRKL